MKVACVQVDGKMPNLALMKIAGWHEHIGDEVHMGVTGDAGHAYISVIWPQNRARALSISKMFTCPVTVGGSGYDYNIKLPDEMEHSMPAYHLWDVDFAMGFTSRGCIRRCDFCIVPDKEGPIRQHSPLSEFMGDKRKVILLDNNILAAPNFIDTAEEIHEMSLKVNFSQGLDIRLIDEENASILSNLKYMNWTFISRQLHFAFDNMKDEAAVRRGISILSSSGIPPKHMMFYMLVGFNTTFEEDMRRYAILWEELGTYPYVMIFNNEGTPTLRAFARWVNKRIHKTASWLDYEHGPKKAGETRAK